MLLSTCAFRVYVRGMRCDGKVRGNYSAWRTIGDLLAAVAVAHKPYIKNGTTYYIHIHICMCVWCVWCVCCVPNGNIVHPTGSLSLSLCACRPPSMWRMVRVSVASAGSVKLDQHWISHLVIDGPTQRQTTADVFGQQNCHTATHYTHYTHYSHTHTTVYGALAYIRMVWHMAWHCSHCPVRI